jgi:glycosyltransferase involved in cell wall biosynthesis
VVTNSAATARLVEQLGAVAEVIPPGVDFVRFRPGDRAVARSRLGLPDGVLIALYVGGLSLRKGADVFAAALAGLPTWQGVMVGGGELESELRQQASVRLVGVAAPNEIPAWMQAASVIVVPSREEPLGLAAVEALGCGIPVVASRTGGLVDVIRDDENGLLVEPADPAALVAALVRLEDASLRDRLAGAARASVEGHDLRITTERMASLWRRLGVRT